MSSDEAVRHEHERQSWIAQRYAYERKLRMKDVDIATLEKKVAQAELKSAEARRELALMELDRFENSLDGVEEVAE